MAAAREGQEGNGDPGVTGARQAENTLAEALNYAEGQGLTDATYWVRDARAALASLREQAAEAQKFEHAFYHWLDKPHRTERLNEFVALMPEHWREAALASLRKSSEPEVSGSDAERASAYLQHHGRLRNWPRLLECAEVSAARAVVSRDEAPLNELREKLARAAYVAENLMGMIDRETWRSHGADDGQGHYEGDYHAEKIADEIKEWAKLAAAAVPEGETT